MKFCLIIQTTSPKILFPQISSVEVSKQLVCLVVERDRVNAIDVTKDENDKCLQDDYDDCVEQDEIQNDQRNLQFRCFDEVKIG